MNDEQILNAIDNYITSRLYHYAIMINGKWGCGKTYFITKTLIPHLENNASKTKFTVNYVSLYGIKEPSEISDALLAQTIEDELNKRTNLNKKRSHIITSLISKAMNIGSNAIGSSKNDLLDIFTTISSFDDHVIVFDDLERCSCDVNTVLGYINNFVEHSNAFIIVVSNEEEIGRWQLESNPELQMLVLLNKRFDVPVPLTDAEEISFYAMANGNEPQPSHTEMSINPAKMRTMREYVFNSNEQYKRIKEKVIGITIDYVPDLPEIYKKVIDESRIEKSLLDATANLIEFFLDIAQKENHPNIRSFQFFLEKTKSIFGIIGEQPIFVQDTIIKYCFRSCILHMKGVSQEAWESEFGMRCYGSPFIETDNIYGFKFIDDFIKTNVIIKEDVLSAIKHFVDYKTQMGELDDDPVGLIRGWYLVDDEKINAWLAEIMNNICNGKYSTFIFPVILKYVSVLEEHDICGSMGRQIIDTMKNHINHASYEDLDALGHEQFFLEGKAAEIYRCYKSEISEAMHRVLQDSEKDQWSKLLEDKKQWAENLTTFIRNCSGNMRSFIYWIEPEQLYSLVLESKNDQLFAFRRTLAGVYNSGMYFNHKDDDYLHLTEFQQLLIKTDRSSIIKTKGAHIDWLVTDIQKYLGKMKVPQREPENK